MPLHPTYLQHFMQCLRALFQAGLLHAVPAHYYPSVEEISDEDDNAPQPGLTAGSRSAPSSSSRRSAPGSSTANNTPGYSNPSVIDSENEEIFRRHAFSDDDDVADDDDDDVADDDDDDVASDDEEDTTASGAPNPPTAPQIPRRRLPIAGRTPTPSNPSSASRRRVTPKGAYLGTWNLSGLPRAASNAVYASRDVRGRINRRVSKETYTGTVVLGGNYDMKRTACKHEHIDHIAAYQGMSRDEVNAMVSGQLLTIGT